MIRMMLLLLSIASYGSELILVSNDPSPANLKLLEEKYRQPLIIDEKDVYIVPKSCQLERYYGGVSEAQVKLVSAPFQTDTIIMTQEVFDAKESTHIVNKIESDKAVALVEGKVSKAFLEDKEGRGFGGASEVALDLSSQKEEAIKSASSIMNADKERQKQTSRAACRLMDNGLGYRLDGIKQGRMYQNNQYIDLKEHVVLFQ